MTILAVRRPRSASLFSGVGALGSLVVLPLVLLLLLFASGGVSSAPPEVVEGDPCGPGTPAISPALVSDEPRHSATKDFSQTFVVTLAVGGDERVLVPLRSVFTCGSSNLLSASAQGFLLLEPPSLRSQTVQAQRLHWSRPPPRAPPTT